MPRFNCDAVLHIIVEADDPKKAQKLLWALLSRVGEVQLFDNDGNVEIEDWDLSEELEDEEQQGNGGDRSNGGGSDGDDDSGGSEGKSRRGFAAMDPDKRREIAAKGGRASGGGEKQPDEQLRTMEQFRDSHDLNPQGRKEVEEAIEKRKNELAQEAQH